MAEDKITKKLDDFTKLIEKYEGNELFDNLLDLSLNIDAIFELLMNDDYEIKRVVKKL